MDMGCSTSVMTWEEGFELSNTIPISWLYATAPGLVNIRFVVEVAIALINNTRVYTSRVAVPDFEVKLRDGLTSIDIDNLVVQYKVDTFLILLDVPTDRFTADV